MIVSATSDTHRHHAQLTIPPCDLFIHAGDATNYGKMNETMMIGSWLRDLKAEHKIFVPGNHELDFYHKLPWSKQWLLEKCPRLHILINDRVSIQGKQIHGFSYTPPFFDWGFMLEDDRLRQQAQNIQEGLDLLICHGPPRGVLDLNEDMMPCGSQVLLERILEVKPKVVIFGHIHYQGGMRETFNGITFFNLAAVDDRHLVRNQPTVFEI